jgi:hypothetical protein
MNMPNSSGVIDVLDIINVVFYFFVQGWLAPRYGPTPWGQLAEVTCPRVSAPRSLIWLADAQKYAAMKHQQRYRGKRFHPPGAMKDLRHRPTRSPPAERLDKMLGQFGERANRRRSR